MDTELEIKKINERLDSIEETLKKFTSDASIPLEVDVAFRARLLNDLGTLVTSNVSPTAHNKAVNEAGAGSYSVMDKPTGFLQVVIAGVVCVVPYF